MKSNINKDQITILFNKFENNFNFDDKIEYTLNLLLNDFDTPNKEIICGYLVDILKSLFDEIRCHEDNYDKYQKLKTFFCKHFTLYDIYFIMMNHKYSICSLAQSIKKHFPEDFENIDFYQK